MCPLPDPPKRTGVNISGSTGAVAGDIVGGDKITLNLGFDSEMKAKLNNLMALLSGRAADRQRLAVRWIIEIASSIFVDEMRMLYVGASTAASLANVTRYPEFVALARQHIEELNDQFTRYNGDLEINFLAAIRAIEQRQLWTFNRLKSGPCSPSDAKRLFGEMRITSGLMHRLCTAALIEGYDTTTQMVGEIGPAVWEEVRPSLTGRPRRTTRLLDELFRSRLMIQSILLRRLQEKAACPISTIADDIHQSFALAYFVVDRWLMELDSFDD